MKQFTLKSVLVIALFFFGVSINNSCGESPIDDNLSSMYNSIRTLQNEVTNLRQEIKRLDSEISALKSTGGGSQSGTVCSEKYIDGLYFWHGALVGTIKYQKVGDSMEDTYEYTYDNYGRLISCITTSTLMGNTTTSKVSCEYSGKKVIRTVWDSKNPDTTSQIITEYY